MAGIRYIIALWSLFILMFSVFPVRAEPTPPAVSAEELFIKLQALIADNPNNLDNFFDYAKVATALGRYDDAIKAYQHMLTVEPLLHRVKLDLALLYVRTGQYKDARVLFQEVLDTKPPEDVTHNINILMEEVNTALEKHTFSGSLSVGYNYDTNANSAPRTGEISFVDISLPLSGDALRQADSQYFGAAVVNYRYRLPNPPEGTVLDWNARGTLYNSTQARLDTLDINVLGIKTGPSIELQNYKLRFALEGGYQLVQLDNNDYLYLTSLDFNTAYRYSEKIALYSMLTLENRHFVNTPENTTFTDRNGNAYQARLGGNYFITNKDILGISGTYRRENTRQDYLNNNQIDLSASYTHQFTEDSFVNLYAGNRWSFYDDADIFVSSTTRHDSEAYATLTLGKEIHKDVIASIGYQYRLITSNVQNYAYDNHRTSVSLGWSF